MKQGGDQAALYQLSGMVPKETFIHKHKPFLFDVRLHRRSRNVNGLIRLAIEAFPQNSILRCGTVL